MRTGTEAMPEQRIHYSGIGDCVSTPGFFAVETVEVDKFSLNTVLWIDYRMRIVLGAMTCHHALSSDMHQNMHAHMHAHRHAHTHTHTRTHARTHARMHAHTDAFPRYKQKLYLTRQDYIENFLKISQENRNNQENKHK